MGKLIHVKSYKVGMVEYFGSLLISGGIDLLWLRELIVNASLFRLSCSSRDPFLLDFQYIIDINCPIIEFRINFTC